MSRKLFTLTYSLITGAYAVHAFDCKASGTSRRQNNCGEFPTASAATRAAHGFESEKAGQPIAATVRICKCASPIIRLTSRKKRK